MGEMGDSGWNKWVGEMGDWVKGVSGWNGWLGEMDDNG